MRHSLFSIVCLAPPPGRLRSVSSRARACLAVWHESMSGFTVNSQMFLYDNRNVTPLQQLALDQGWFVSTQPEPSTSPRTKPQPPYSTNISSTHLHPTNTFIALPFNRNVTTEGRVRHAERQRPMPWLAADGVPYARPRRPQGWRACDQSDVSAVNVADCAVDVCANWCAVFTVLPRQGYNRAWRAGVFVRGYKCIGIR